MYRSKAGLPQASAKQGVGHIDPSLRRLRIGRRIEDRASWALAMADGVDDQLVQHLAGEGVFPRVARLGVENGTNPPVSHQPVDETGPSAVVVHQVEQPLAVQTRQDRRSKTCAKPGVLSIELPLCEEFALALKLPMPFEDSPTDGFLKGPNVHGSIRTQKIAKLCAVGPLPLDPAVRRATQQSGRRPTGSLERVILGKHKVPAVFFQHPPWR